MFLRGDLAGPLQLQPYTDGNPSYLIALTPFAPTPQGIDPPTFRASSAVSWWHKKERDVILDLNATQKDPHAIHEAKPHQDRGHQLSFHRNAGGCSTRISELIRTNRLRN